MDKALKEILGEEKVDILKDRIIDVIVDRVERDLEDYSTYEWIIDPEMIEDCARQAFDEVKGALIEKYKAKFMEKASQRFDKLLEEV